MQVLKFQEKNNRYVITVLTNGDTHDLWNRFKGRVIEDNEDHRTASTYCEYESSSEGKLYLLRYDESNTNNECLNVSENDAKDWKDLPPVMFETGGIYHFHIKLSNIKGKARIIHPLKDVTDCFEYVDTGNYTGLLTGVFVYADIKGSKCAIICYENRGNIFNCAAFGSVNTYNSDGSIAAGIAAYGTGLSSVRRLSDHCPAHRF